MNKLTKNALKWVAALSVIAVLGYAGSSDYREAVISSISQELYLKVKHDLGGTASEKEICDAYIRNKTAYDALGI